MLYQEAIWISERLAKMESLQLSPILNLGCQSKVFRESYQPWIDEFIFDPLRKRGCRIINSDLQQSDGIELVGDCTTREFQNSVRELGVKSAFLCNILEHVTDRQSVADSMEELLSVGGILVVSCPFEYPTHPDPIDNGFRPTPDELSKLFPSFEVIESATVVCRPYQWYLEHVGGSVYRKIARLLLPFIRPSGWLATVRHLAWYRRPFSASCVVMRKR